MRGSHSDEFFRALGAKLFDAEDCITFTRGRPYGTKVMFLLRPYLLTRTIPFYEMSRLVSFCAFVPVLSDEAWAELLLSDYYEMDKRAVRAMDTHYFSHIEAHAI